MIPYIEGHKIVRLREEIRETIGRHQERIELLRRYDYLLREYQEIRDPATLIELLALVEENEGE